MSGLALAPSTSTDLKAALQSSLRIRKIRAMILVAPLAIFVVVVFLGPILMLLARSVEIPDMAEMLPNTARALADWSGEGLPEEPAWEAVVLDLKAAQGNGTASRIATVMNQDASGTRSLIVKSAREAGGLAPPFQPALIGLDARWSDPAVWSNLKRISAGWTMAYYANALDFRIVGNGNLARQPEDRRIYVALFARTIKVAGCVTLLCLLLAYPVANLLAGLPARRANLLLMLVLLPLWTSLLVRTTAWIALLQKQGVINDLLVWAGIIGEENRMALVYNLTGTLIAMTHVLLPFMILPIYAVMKSVPPSYMRAARSLGASPPKAFLRVYLPQTMPGVGAGVILVFILAVGYYITPSLVGGDSGALISNLIAYHMQKSLNWGLAAALSAVLLVGVLFLYWVYDRIVGIDNLRLG